MKQMFLNVFRSPDDGGTGTDKSLDDLIAAVSQETTAGDSAVALLASDSGLIATLKQQLADALSGTTLPPDVQAKVNAVFASAQANAQRLSDAVTANTPQA